MMQGSISSGIGKMQPFLNKHENTNSISMDNSMPEGDCVTTTQEDPLNSNSRTWRHVGKSDPHETDYSPGIHKMS